MLLMIFKEYYYDACIHTVIAVDVIVNDSLVKDNMKMYLSLIIILCTYIIIPYITLDVECKNRNETIRKKNNLSDER